MLKRIILAIAGCFALIGLACAQVDANRADAAALQSVKGIGPATAQRIVKEREAHGPYRDWTDFERRVKGVGGKRAASLSESGLNIDGQALSNAPGGPAKADAAEAPATSEPAASGGDGRSGTRRAGTTANPFNDKPRGQ
jgi:competence protein ComEA